MLPQLNDRLLALGFTPEELAKAEAAATQQKISLMAVIEGINKVHEHKLLDAFASAYNVRPVHLEAKDIPQNIIDLVPKDIATKHRVLPIERAGNNIVLAMANPLDLDTTQTIRFKTNCFVSPILASETRLTEAIQKYYGRTLDLNNLKNTDPNAVQEFQEDSRQVIGDSDKDEAPVIKIVNYTLQECLNRRASDIHIEPYEKHIRIRLRIDGELVELMQPPINLKAKLIARVKIISKLDISEQRLPQDGSIKLMLNGKPVDFRVNSLPTVHGEKIVMRILDKSSLQVDMTKLGFDKSDLEKFKSSIHSPFGMVLVTGPTGSGKTTTLYSALADLNKADTNIVTAEDPVEFSLDGINQVQMQNAIGMDFAKALKAFLRQDPDVIMVGEIRDKETAEISIKAALTGHMVLSTLHTNTAPETISRLLNMGIEPFNLVSALTCVVAQRLMRKICDKCKIEDDRMTPQGLIDLGIPEQYVDKVKAYRGAGCPACGGSGGRGRTAIHEVLKMNDDVRRAIIDNKPALEIKQIAMATGMRTMRQAALVKLTQGLVSAEEVTSGTVSDSSDSTSTEEENVA